MIHGWTKQKSLNNFLSMFPQEETIIFIEGNKELKTYVERNYVGIEVYYSPDKLGDAGSFRKLLRYALSLPDYEEVYFVEDDYLHTGDARQVLMEGLDVGHYVSLYDHTDKYLPPDTPDGNPLVNEDGTEDTKIFRTKNSHWKYANSTTFCFATSVATLRQDKNIFYHFTSGPNCEDFNTFRELIKNGRILITPLPGRSTHVEAKWLSPFVNWGNYYSYDS